MNEDYARNLLIHVLGIERFGNLDEEVIENTPARMTKGLGQLLDGYSVDIESLMKTFPAPSKDIVVVRDIPFSSMCEHHVLPFRGTVSVAYIPDTRVVGLSKVPRLVRAVSRRLQIQERMTCEIADGLARLDPSGIAVVVKGVHMCAELRGIETRAEMVTSHMRGLFKEDASARAEVMRLFE